MYSTPPGRPTLNQRGAAGETTTSIPKPSPSMVQGALCSAHCAMRRADSSGIEAQAPPCPPGAESVQSARARRRGPAPRRAGGSPTAAA
eukprot:6093685-Pyramimonas_sp.AAC.1